MSGPLSAVLTAFQAGATSMPELAHETGLPRDVVEAAVDHLVRAGRLEATTLTTGCPTGGCGSCASGGSHGAPGCGAGAPSDARTGPVLVALRMRPPG